MLPGGATPRAVAKLDYPAVTDDGSYFLRPGTYTWWVQAFKRATAPRHGGDATFTITEPDAVGRSADRPRRPGASDAAHRLHRWHSPTRGPFCDNVPATPVLDWEPVPGAGGYLVYLAEDPDFTNRVLSPYAVTVTRGGRPTISD